MYSHILISTDGSEFAGKGVDHGLALAKALGAKVTLVTATEAFPVYVSSIGDAWTPGPEEFEAFEARQKEHADGILSKAKASADAMGVPAETVHVANSAAAEAIMEVAGQLGCDLIAMSSHGRRGLSRLLLGSQTAEVLSHSKVPVLVVR